MVDVQGEVTIVKVILLMVFDAYNDCFLIKAFLTICVSTRTLSEDLIAFKS